MFRAEHFKIANVAFAPLVALAMAMLTALTTEAFSVPQFGVTSTRASPSRSGAEQPQLLFARPKSKWDLFDDDDVQNPSFESKIPVPNDMLYIERNVRRCHENFLSLRNAGGKEICNDVYCKSPMDNVEEMWYVGKITKISDVTLEDAIARQWNIIETHATNLRPIELYPHRGNLELWTAPGDTELDVAYNRPDLLMKKMEKYEVKPEQLKSNLIGFQGEVYQEGEEGFRTWRKSDGSPARPEINPGGETRPPTQDEMEQLRQEMDRQNISVEDIYKYQQEKEGKN